MNTLGEILRKARERKKITLLQASESTKIHPKYLSALEHDNYVEFSGKVHSKGFLKIYAGFLGLRVPEVLALWRREYEKGLEAREVKRRYKVRALEKTKSVVTPSVILTLFITISVLAFFAYLFYQYRSFTGDPSLEVYYPRENMVVTTDILDVTGKSDLDSKVFINNQEIIPSPDGSFAQSLKLKEGLNTIVVSAENQLARRVEVIRTVIYKVPREIPPEKTLETTESTESTDS